jgi:hypothetical protein
MRRRSVRGGRSLSCAELSPEQQALDAEALGALAYGRVWRSQPAMTARCGGDEALGLGGGAGGGGEGMAVATMAYRVPGHAGVGARRRTGRMQEAKAKSAEALAEAQRTRSSKDLHAGVPAGTRRGDRSRRRRRSARRRRSLAEAGRRWSACGARGCFAATRGWRGGALPARDVDGVAGQARRRWRIRRRSTSS